MGDPGLGVCAPAVLEVGDLPMPVATPSQLIRGGALRERLGHGCRV